MRLAAMTLLALTSYVCAYGSDIQGLCNTGVVGPCTGLNGYGSSLAPVGGEQNWVLLGGTAFVPGSPPSPPWIAANATSRWISPTADTIAPFGEYSYQLVFSLSSLASLSTAPVTGRYASDNQLLSVSLNGQQVGGFPLNQAWDGYTLWTNFTIPNTANFILGQNMVLFTVQNGGNNFQGLRVEWGSPHPADAGVPEPSSLVLGGAGLAGLYLAARKRRAGTSLQQQVQGIGPAQERRIS